MSEFLKGNFKVQKDIKESTSEAKKSAGQALMAEVRKKALSSLGGSMVYMERTDLGWDGEDETETKVENDQAKKKPVENSNE